MSRPPNTPSPYPNITLFSVIIQKWSVCISLYIGICIQIFLCISHKSTHRLCLHASKPLFYYSSCFSKPDVPLDHLWFLLQLPWSVLPLHADKSPTLNTSTFSKVTGTCPVYREMQPEAEGDKPLDQPQPIQDSFDQ